MLCVTPGRYVGYMFGSATIDQLESTVVEAEAAISRLRAIQVDAMHQLDEAGVTNMDGARSMVDWTTAKLDIAPETAQSLVEASRHLASALMTLLQKGECTLDRALATSRLAAAGANEFEMSASAGLDITGIRRLIARQRRYTRTDERRVFAEQHIVLQPNLDESHYRIHGSLDGVGGRTVEKALLQRSDELPADTSSRAHRYALSLTSICQDSLDPGSDAEPSAGGGVVLFADLDRVADTGGEAGAEVEFGPRIGPAALEEALCNGPIQLVGLRNGKPMVTSDNTKAIPPAVRNFVTWRDGGCAADGCRSRYRLQVHHIRQRAYFPKTAPAQLEPEHGSGGVHDPDNLTCLCWFHHHVVIHGRGYTIDPASPPQRRRFISPRRRGPP